jgi:hypothetical protein
MPHRSTTPDSFAAPSLLVEPRLTAALSSIVGHEERMQGSGKVFVQFRCVSALVVMKAQRSAGQVTPKLPLLPMKITPEGQFPYAVSTSRSAFLLALCLTALSLLPFAAVCRGDTSFATGPTWGISLNNGASYGAPDRTNPRTLPDGTTVTGIEGGNPFNVGDRYYRYTFTLTELTLSASTQFVTNTLFALLVNGNPVDLTLVMNSGPNTNNSSPVTGLPIPGAYFHTGSNDIVFETHSLTGGAAGDPFLAARVDIRAVPEPSAWAMMLAGGSVFVAIRRAGRRAV